MVAFDTLTPLSPLGAAVDRPGSTHVLLRQVKNLNCINGEFVPAADGTTLPVYNPATNEVVGEVPRSKAEDVNAGACAFNERSFVHANRPYMQCV